MKLYKIIDKIIIFLIQALVFTVPLYFAFLYKDYSVFTMDKTAIFQILVEVLLFFTILHIIIARSNLFEQSNEPLATAKSKVKWISGDLLFWFILLFFLIFILSVIFSIDFHQSFWGSYWRKQGLITYLHYLLFFFIIIINFSCQESLLFYGRRRINSSHQAFRPFWERCREGTEEVFNKLEKIISAILLSSFFVSLLGILQWLGYDPLPWQERIPIFGRITSTMGQPIFLANYLLFVIPLTVYRLFRFTIYDSQFNKKSILFLLRRVPQERKRTNNIKSIQQKIKNNTKLIILTFYFLLLILQLLTLFFTYTRGAIIGLFAGILFFLVLYPIAVKKNKKLFFKLFILFITITLLFVFYIKSSRKTSDFSNRLYWRVKTALNTEYGSAALRIRYWQSSFTAISNKLLFGYGPENQQSVFVKYYDQTWIPYEKIGLIPDRAHNEYLDIALSGGILLLLSYMMMLFYCFYVGIKNIYSSKDNKRKLLLIFILSALFAYLVAIFFAFSVVETNIFFFLFIALIFILSSNFTFLERDTLQGERRLGAELSKKRKLIRCCKERQQESVPQSYDKLQRRYYPKAFDDLVKTAITSHVMYIVLCVIFCVLCIACYINVNLVRADYHFREARSAFVDGMYIKMYEHYARAIKLNNRESYYKQKFVDDAMQSMFKIDSIEYRQLVSEYAKGFLKDYQGKDFYDALVRAKIYALLGRFQDKKYLNQAEDEFKNLILLSPYLPNEHIGLAQVYLDKKDYSKAKEVFENILLFLPQLDSKYLNKEHQKEVEKLVMKVNSGIDYCDEQLRKSGS